MRFHDLDSLKAYIVDDKKHFAMNPIRFVSVDSMEMWRTVKSFLESIADEQLLLSKFCDGADITPNLNRVISALKKKEKSVCLSPLSEYLRVVPEEALKDLVRILSQEYENTYETTIRYYIPLYRMKSVLNLMPQDDPRRQDAFIFLESCGEDDYNLTIIQKALNIEADGNNVFGFRQYLQYWEQNPSKPLVLHTDFAVSFKDNHFLDDVQVITSSFAFIFTNFNIPGIIKESDGTGNDWDQFAPFFSARKTFSEACCDVLNVKCYSSKIFEQWHSFSNFQKWVLWLFVKTQSTVNYEVFCAREADGVQAFVENLYINIAQYVDDPLYQKIYDERKIILHLISEAIPKSYSALLEKITPIQGLKIVTDLTDFGRKKCFWFLQRIPECQIREAWKILKSTYPILAYYLGDFEVNNEVGIPDFIFTYLRKYKWGKVRNEITEDFISLSDEHAKNRGKAVYELHSRNAVVGDFYLSNSSILFVDGMGAEYLDLLKYILSPLEKNGFYCTYKIAYCNLPSITEGNKDFLVSRTTMEPPITALDKLKHSDCKYPENIIRELVIFEDIRNRVETELTAGTSNVIVTSDHGTSRMAVLVRDTLFDKKLNKPDNLLLNEYGRTAVGVFNEQDYPTAICDGNRLTFADYSRFASSGAPIDETHGGASIEEWTVPVISISRANQLEELPAIIKVISGPEHKPDLATKKITVRFSVSGNIRTNLYVSVNGTQIKCLYKDNYYEFTYGVATINEPILHVKVIDYKIIGEFDIKLKKGLQKNTGFNI